MLFEGVASSTSLDRQRERMTEKAIAKMTQYEGIELLPAHSSSLRELGRIEECWVDNSEFRVRGRFDRENPEARRLFQRLQSGERFGLSVGGKVTGAFWAWDEEVGGPVKYIDDVALDHVALCGSREAVNPDTYLSVLAKAAEEVAGEAVRPSEGRNHGSGGMSEEAMLKRLCQAVAAAWRGLWPFAKSVEGGKEGESDRGEEPRWKELEEKLERLEGRLEEVRAALEGGDSLAKAEEETRVAPGEPQGLRGQRERRDEEIDFWKGVL